MSKSMDRVRLLSKALKIRMLSSYPFYGMILGKLCQIKECTSVKTAATDGVDIFFNPKFASTLEDSEINFVLIHEMFHVILLHRYRFETNQDKIENHRMWNIACDAVINWEINNLIQEFSHSGIEIKVPEGGVLLKENDRIRDLTGKTAEDIYDELKQRPDEFKDKMMSDDVTTNDIPSGDSGEESNDSQDKKGSNPLDNKKVKVHKSASERIKEAKEKANEVKRALAEAKSHGYTEELGSTIRNAIELTLRKPKIRWNRYLRRFLTDALSDENSYDTPNKKYLPYDLILPGMGVFEQALGDIHLMVDTSGSISSEELNNIFSEAVTIAAECRATLSLTLWHTEAYHTIREVEPEDFLEETKKLPFKAGGTDISCVYKMLEETKDKSTAYVIFTDGCFDIPQVSTKLRRKTILGLTETIGYDRKLETLGKIVSIRDEG